MILFVAGVLCLAAVAAGLPSTYGSHSSYSKEDTSLTLIYQNDLNFTDDGNHIGAILLDAMPQRHAEAACKAIGESLLTETAITKHASDFEYALAYTKYSSESSGNFWINDGTLLIRNANTLSFGPAPYGLAFLQPLCTQSSNQDNVFSAVATANNEITIPAKQNSFIGYRNQKSFRFLGIPYADPPQRWEYSTVYSGSGKTINATKYDAECSQNAADDSEDCLFINIQTPYIPKVRSRKQLRPVMFWIHGGGFTGGTGNDPGSDGGNLASREDIVVVEINYRLSTLGFLTVPGTNVTGNYGIGDQITALKWTIENIAFFGGDPTKITIIGESAGAGSVRTLLGSPEAIGKFQGSVAMSNLGGGVTLGLSGDYGTTYSSYLTPEQSYAQAGQSIFTAAGCGQSTIDAQIACLRQIPADKLVSLPSVARYVTQDGRIVNTENLDVVNRNGSAAKVHTIWGTTANDGASFTTYPQEPIANETQGISVALGISTAEAQRVIDSGLFPFYDTGNLTLDSFNVSQRVATDKTFRCVDEATVYAGTESGAFKSSYFYQMDRTEGGYDPDNFDDSTYNDPEKPYFRLHGSDMPWVFGNLQNIRDSKDLSSMHVMMSYFASFVRTGNPNADPNYLSVRGYTDVLENMRNYGVWEAVSSTSGPIRLLDWPSTSASFPDTKQCTWLGYPLDYYLTGGKR